MNPTSLRTSTQSFLAWFGPLRVFLRGIIFIYIKLLMVINRGLQFYGHWRIRWSQLISGSCCEYYVLESSWFCSHGPPLKQRAALAWWLSTQQVPQQQRHWRYRRPAPVTVNAVVSQRLVLLESPFGDNGHEWGCYANATLTKIIS